MTIRSQPCKREIYDCYGSTFMSVAEHHARSLAEVEFAKRDQMDRNVATDVLARALTNEARLRISLIRWQPSSVHEAQTKLLYLVHFLAETRSSFDTSTMSELESSIAHLLR